MLKWWYFIWCKRNNNGITVVNIIYLKLLKLFKAQYPAEI